MDAQGRPVAAAVLGAAHFAAYYFADTVIMGEVRGSHRFPTLTALGALGGISAFQNPLEVLSSPRYLSDKSCAR